MVDAGAIIIATVCIPRGPCGLAGGAFLRLTAYDCVVYTVPNGRAHFVPDPSGIVYVKVPSRL